MFDIGWTEMMVVAVVAILFVGPKELPGMLRTFGRAVKKVRALAGDFQQQFDNALKDAELDGVKDSINKVRDLDPTKQLKDKLNPLKADLEKTEKDINDPATDDPYAMFDESKAPEAPTAVTVDVEAALERQADLDADNKTPPASGKNAVPGFSSVPDPAPPVAKKAATRKTPAKKTAAKKPTTRTAAKKKPAPSRKSGSTSKTAKAKSAKSGAKASA